jgi:BASS family bile acid:Na+ symporter
MFTVGTNLTPSALVTIKRAPSNYIWGTLGQVFLLPVLAYALVLILQPRQEIAVGMLLVSLCPAGAVSNLYTFIGKGNIALSVTLTMLTNLIAILTLPIAITLLFATAMTTEEFAQFAQQQIHQLVAMLLLPMLAGALTQHFFAKSVAKIKSILEPMAFIALLAVIGSIFAKHFAVIKTQFAELMLPAVCFTLGALMIAQLLAKSRGLNSTDTAAFLAEFPCRNLALVAMISVTFIGNTEYLIFAAMFFAIESPILLFLMLRHRIQLSRQTATT